MLMLIKILDAQLANKGEAGEDVQMVDRSR